MNSVEGNIIIYLHTNDRQVNHVHGHRCIVYACNACHVFP